MFTVGLLCQGESNLCTSGKVRTEKVVCFLKWISRFMPTHHVLSLLTSAGAMMVGIVIGGIARLSTNNLKLFEFSPEVFFFVLLPPIIFGKY